MIASSTFEFFFLDNEYIIEKTSKKRSKKRSKKKHLV